MAVVLPLADGVHMDRVVQKGTSALEFLLQDRDPRVRVVESEVTATEFNSCPTQGNPDQPYYSARKKFVQWLVTVKAATMIQSAWQSFVCYTYFTSSILSLYSNA